MLRELGLMTLMTLLLLAIGFVIGSYFGNPILFMQGALILSFIFNFLTYYFSDKIVLLMTGAKIVSPNEAPKLHEIVERAASKAGIPKPKVAIVDLPIPNAFATGRNPKNGVVAVTKSLLTNLSEDELEGVIGHELSHIKNRDTLISAMAATIAGAISYIAYMGRWGLILGSSRDREREGNALIALLSLILIPIAATIIQLSISRSREYKADESAAYLTGKPLSLANALLRIQSLARLPRGIELNPATSHLWIVNPLSGRDIIELFSTHPSIEKRIARLKQIAEKLGNYY